MNDSHPDPELLDALMADTCQRLANIIGLPCPADPGNQLRLLTLLETGIRHALTQAHIEALEHGYTDTEIDQLRRRLEITP